MLASGPMEAFELDALLRAQAAGGQPYHEFIRSHDLSVGLYVLPAGATDPQGPHTEDEIYHVVSGSGRILVGDEDRAVVAGSIVFVPADTVHRFHDIGEELVALVVFGPAEYTHRVDHDRGHPTAHRPPEGQVRPPPTRPPRRRSSSRASSAARPTGSWRKNAKTSTPSVRNGSIRAAQASSSAAV